MRGCLSVLFLAIVFVSVAIWFGGPPLASGVVSTALTGAGLAADTLDVEVTADPPLTLAVGRAKEIAVTATGVRWNDLRMASLELRLGSVDLVARTASTADGHFGGVQLLGTGTEPIIADVEFGGQADAARTTITVDAATVDMMAAAAFEAKFGIRPSSASLVEPDLVRVNTGGLTLSGRLAVAADGSVVAVTNGKTIRLVTPDPAVPLRLTGLSVASGALVLRGTFDVLALLR